MRRSGKRGEETMRKIREERSMRKRGRSRELLCYFWWEKP